MSDHNPTDEYGPLRTDADFWRSLRKLADRHPWLTKQAPAPRHGPVADLAVKCVMAERGRIVAWLRSQTVEQHGCTFLPPETARLAEKIEEGAHVHT